jgi:uncharacterized protein YidB (DUF937 family)
MVALLGLLAVAGYQNRDKISEMLGGLNKNQPLPDGSMPQGQQQQTGGGLEGMLGSLGGMLGGNSVGGSGLGSVLSGGLGDLVDRFNQAGTGAKAQSWVNDGSNEDIDTTELEHTLGADTIEALIQQTGLDRQELLERLAKTLPEAVNKLTPDGRIPTPDEANRIVQPTGLA